MTLSAARYLTVVAVFLMHSSAKKGGSATTTAKLPASKEVQAFGARAVASRQCAQTKSRTQLKRRIVVVEEELRSIDGEPLVVFQQEYAASAGL